MYTTGQFHKFCKTVFGDYLTSKQGQEIIVSCPFCLFYQHVDKKKLSIKVSNHKLHCWVCKYKSKNLYHILRRFHPVFLEEYRREYGGIVLQEKENVEFEKTSEEVAQERTDDILESFVYLSSGLNSEVMNLSSTRDVKNALDYIARRNVSQEHVWRHSIGFVGGLKRPDLWSVYRDRVFVLSRGLEGNVNFWVARTINERTFPKYLSPPISSKSFIFNHLYLDFKKPLLIVEGAFDIMGSGYDNTTCLLGKSLRKADMLFQQIVLNKTPVVLCLDNDAQKEQTEIAFLLCSYGVDVKIIALQDKKDPADIGIDKFQNYMKQARKIDGDRVEKLEFILQSLRQKVSPVIGYSNQQL